MAIYIKQRRKKKVDKNCCSTYAHLYPTWHWVSPCCIFFTLGYVHRYNSSFFASKWGRGLKVDHQKIFIPPYHKDLTKGWSWNRYSSLAPIIWATLDGPHAPPSLLLEEVAVPRFLLTYIHAKLCFTSSIETLKYQPSKNSWLLPSKWYLREREREREKERKKEDKTKQNTIQKSTKLSIIHSCVMHDSYLSPTASWRRAQCPCLSLSLLNNKITFSLSERTIVRTTQINASHNAQRVENMNIAWLLSLSNSKLKKSTKPMSLSFPLSLCSLTKLDILFQKGPIAENWANPCFLWCTKSWKHEHWSWNRRNTERGGEGGIVLSLPTVRITSFCHWSGRHGTLL